MLRGGVGRYYDFAYTNANILFAVIGAQSAFGQVYSQHQQHGHPQRRRLASTRWASRCPPNQLTNLDQAQLRATSASPLIKQPYTDQANLGLREGPRQRLRDRGGRASTRTARTWACGPASTPAPPAARRPAASSGTLPTTRRPRTSASTSPRAAATTRASALPSRSGGTASCSSWAATRCPSPRPTPACARRTSSASTTCSTPSTRSPTVRRTRPAPTTATA